MFHPFPIWIGVRFSLSRKGNTVLSFVSWLSLLGVACGVAILIIAQSVINGSIITLRGEALKSVPHAIITGTVLAEHWTDIADSLSRSGAMVAVTPNIEGDATLTYQGSSVFTRLRGIDPNLELAALNRPTSNDREVLARLAATPNGIILAPGLARDLGIFGEAELSANALSGLLKRRLSDTRGLQVVGYADFGLYGNRSTALVNLTSADTLFADEELSALRLRVKVVDPMAVTETLEIGLQSLKSDPKLTNMAGLGAQNLANLQAETWQQAQASLFRALAIEKYMTGFMLLMIVAIGAVNIISTLVMAVGDKRADIAILRSMGASRSAIMLTFIAQGMLSGLLGTVIGAGLGVLLATQLSPISLFLERLLGQLLGQPVFLLSHLQAQMSWVEVAVISSMALLISLLATLYPAFRASQLEPAETLRYV